MEAGPGEAKEGRKEVKAGPGEAEAGPGEPAAGKGVSGRKVTVSVSCLFTQLPLGRREARRGWGRKSWDG